jgi:enoyl-CoA hydratase/carnithine racemase
MDLEYIKQTNADGVSRIQFDRPEKLNAVNSKVLRELETAIIRCEENEQIRSVVLTGNEKAFVAGADIDHMAKASIGDAYRLTDLTMRVQERLADLPKTATRRGLSTSLDQDLQIEQSLFCMLFGTLDQKEGMAAFIEKRKPVFKGE